MIQLLQEIIGYIADYLPLLGSLILVICLALLLHRSIKKQAKVYYWTFGILAFVTFSSMFLPMLGIPFSFRTLFGIPILGSLFQNFGHIYGISFPILILIMYMGALDTKYRPIAKLMSIRKELSIMVGFPVLTHALTRIIHITPTNLRYIFCGESMGSFHGTTFDPTSELLMQIAFFIGLFLFTLFLLLWITSFGKVHKALGGKRWKAIQRWSYLFYGLLFCHSCLLRTSWLIGSEDRFESLKNILALSSTILIFISYLVLRLQKSFKNKRP